MKTYNCYLRPDFRRPGNGYNHSELRRIQVRANSKRAAKAKCRKKKKEVVYVVAESNGCDCRRENCKVCKVTGYR